MPTPPSSDDWKGEHLIRRRPSADDSRRIAMEIAHARRRALGIPVPGREAHNRVCSFLQPKDSNDKD